MASRLAAGAFATGAPHRCCHRVAFGTGTLAGVRLRRRMRPLQEHCAAAGWQVLQRLCWGLLQEDPNPCSSRTMPALSTWNPLQIDRTSIPLEHPHRRCCLCRVLPCPSPDRPLQEHPRWPMLQGLLPVPATRGSEPLYHRYCLRPGTPYSSPSDFPGISVWLVLQLSLEAVTLGDSTAAQCPPARPPGARMHAALAAPRVLEFLL